MQPNNESLDIQIDVCHFDFGDIKLLKRSHSRFYYCYVAQGGFMYLRHVGLLDHYEIMRYSAEIVGDDSWINGSKLFNDLCWLNSSAFNFDSHYKLARDIASLYERNGRYFSKVVALCSNDFEFGMFRMLYSLWKDDTPQINTVRDLEVAVEFLEIDRKLLDRVIAEVDKIDVSERLEVPT
jgi:hypothetical protein